MLICSSLAGTHSIFFQGPSASLDSCHTCTNLALMRVVPLGLVCPLHFQPPHIGQTQVLARVQLDPGLNLSEFFHRLLQRAPVREYLKVLLRLICNEVSAFSRRINILNILKVLQAMAVFVRRGFTTLS